MNIEPFLTLSNIKSEKANRTDIAFENSYYKSLITSEKRFCTILDFFGVKVVILWWSVIGKLSLWTINLLLIYNITLTFPFKYENFLSRSPMIREEKHIP